MKNKECKYKECPNDSAQGKTVCWMHSKREYRANVKLKKEHKESESKLSFEDWKSLRYD